LQEVPGVAAVIVDFPTKTATIAIEDHGFNPEEALGALAAIGYGSSTILR
jgi:copper chaperone CopZ